MKDFPLPTKTAVLKAIAEQINQENDDFRNRERHYTVGDKLTRTQVDDGFTLLRDNLDVDARLFIAPTFSEELLTSSIKHGILKSIRNMAIEKNLRPTKQDKENILKDIMSKYGFDKQSVFSTYLQTIWQTDTFFDPTLTNLTTGENYHFIMPILHQGHYTSLVLSKSNDSIKITYSESFSGDMQTTFEQDLLAYVDKNAPSTDREYQHKPYTWQQDSINCGLFCILLALKAACLHENKQDSLITAEDMSSENYEAFFADCRRNLVALLNANKSQSFTPARDAKRERSDDSDSDVEVVEPPEPKTKRSRGFFDGCVIS